MPVEKIAETCYHNRIVSLFIKEITKNLCCLRGGIYKRPSDSTKVLDAAAYCFYSTRPTKR